MSKIKLSNKCSRCPREELTDITLEEAIALAKDVGKEKPPALIIKMDGEELASYERLCSACRSVVVGYLDGAVRQPTKSSSKRVQKPKAKEKAEPVKAPPAAAKPLSFPTGKPARS